MFSQLCGKCSTGSASRLLAHPQTSCVLAVVPHTTRAGGDTPQDACTVCQPGSYSPGIGTQPCFPCPFLYTSPVGSLTPAACYRVEQCPGGTAPATENPSSEAECACVPGTTVRQDSTGDVLLLAVHWLLAEMPAVSCKRPANGLRCLTGCCVHVCV